MKRFLRVVTVTAVALVAVGATAVPAFAASPSATSLVTSTQFARPGANLTAFGIELTSTTFVSTLNEVRVDFNDVGPANFTFDDDLEAGDGVILWRDSSFATAATQDKLDAGDVAVSSGYSFSGSRATLNITPDYPLPAASASEGSYTFLLTIQLASTVTSGDDFAVTLPTDALQTGLLGTSLPAAVTTATIIADKTPPTVTLFTPPATQTSNFSWRISEPITGVTQDTVALRQHGTATELPVTVSYNAATQTIVGDPVPSLTAGQEYDAVLLPDGPGAITDRAGNPLPPKTNVFRAATNVNELAPGVRYFWRGLANSSTYGGSYLVNNMPGGQIAYKFSGTSIVWYTITDPYQGKASVSIDGKSFGIINNYRSSARYKVGRTFSGLSSGAHTITIRVTGSRGSSSGRDVRVAVDAFRWGGSTVVTPSVSHRWAPRSASGADGGTYRAARFSGTEMSFVFSGTSIAWRTIRGPAMGRAYVYIDGTLKGSFDNYSSSTSYKYMRTFLNLPARLHTIKIKVASTRNSKATDRIIAVDGFVIG